MFAFERFTGRVSYTEPVLKAKWKGLRDTFRAELKKEQVYRKSKFHRNRPVWIHFKSLQFLKEQMLPRPPIWERNAHDNDRASGSESDTPRHQKGNVGRTLSASSALVESDTLAEHILALNGDNALKIESISHQIDVKQEPEDNFENLEFQSVAENLTDNEMMLQNISPEQVLMGDGDSSIGLTVDPLEGGRFDDNYYFLMSLLPHIKTLPADRRMLLRMQMQELVYKEVYKKSSSDIASTS
ncbi:uncharacterized protein LOC107264613 isoform X2 [Cephus cinctus]|uniref:Uncharacterized protein LOC107264613 isoform X2 n=1 Tax=Cephus cinctus TaxID=211228 RepID=A0AAJ7BKV6_CEPCN|nr:uncharacterized protein LOC107264613 isoform X2 [Cephus cinctus]